MRELEKEFGFQGRTLRQMKREGRVCVYELLGRGGVLYGYEVVIIKIAPAVEIKGELYPEREVYPSSSKSSDDWGRVAWSYSRNCFQDALERYAGLLSEQEKYGFSASGAVLGSPQEEVEVG